MYAYHQPVIGQWARQDAENFKDVLRFVILTIQQPLYKAVQDLEDWNSPSEKVREDMEARCLWGHKRAAWENIEANGDAIFADCSQIYSEYADEAVAEIELLSYVARLPGFGLAKGGFVLQLVWGLAGCIDSHNLARFNIKPGRFKASRVKKARPATAYKVVRDYLAVIAAQGGTEALWNGWCEYVNAINAEGAGGSNPGRYTSADHVSELHLTAFALT